MSITPIPMKKLFSGTILVSVTDRNFVVIRQGAQQIGFRLTSAPKIVGLIHQAVYDATKEDRDTRSA